MSNKKKFFLVFVFILLDMFLLIGYLVIRDATMLNDLKKEVNSLSKLDITKDRYNKSIKTRGNYGIVEKSIKSYLDDYAVLLQDELSIMNDKKLTKILSFENYKEDGPEFNESLKYLKDTKKDFNDNMDILLNNLDEDYVKNYINDKIDDPYYRDLYVELMLTDERKNSFKETKELLDSTKIKVNNILDTSTEVLTFLKNNKDSWILEDNEIKFKTSEQYNQYNNLISKIKK